MGKLTTLVAKCPSLLLGATVARVPRLRVKASPEAWLVTRVATAKGGGHPTVYGLRMALGTSSASSSSSSSSSISSSSSTSSTSSSTSSTSSGLAFAAKDCAITGPLKGDWTVVAGAVASEPASVRTSVGLSLHPSLLARALQQQAPFDTLRPALAARAAAEHGRALAAVAAAAAAAAEAAAAKAAAAAAAAAPAAEAKA